MSKLYWKLFIVLLSMLACMPVKCVQSASQKGVRSANSNDAPNAASEKSIDRKENDDENETDDEKMVIADEEELFNKHNELKLREIPIGGHTAGDKNTWTTEEILTHHKYPYETHYVNTGDGYTLVLHRIMPKTGPNVVKRNFPVLIPHCVGGSSADWVLAGPDSSLAMQLSETGYDVWLANNRGNTYSRTHKSYTTKDKEFWNFNLHDLGTKDLPAIIDYVISNTKKEQLHYIGYSMGTCVFYIMASTKPEYQKYFRSQISMAPVSKLGHSTSSVAKLASFNRLLDTLVQTAANGEFNSDVSWMRRILRKYCNKEKPEDQKLCLKLFLFAICGSNKETFNTDILPNIVGHYPASTSSKVVAHLAQFIKRDKFAQYSHGKEKNLEVYNAEEPPLYDLGSIEVPITLIYGPNDKLVRQEDAEWLRDELPQIMNFIRVDDLKFNHVDFLWNRNVKEKINDLVILTFETTDKPKWKYDKISPVLRISFENRVPVSLNKKAKHSSPLRNCFT